MSVVPPRKLRSGKVIHKSSFIQNSSKSQLNMNSDWINRSNVDTDSNLPETHLDERSSSSQAEVNHQIVKSQTDTTEIKTLLVTLTQQVISRSEEETAPRASGSRTQKRVDKVTGDN